MYQFYTSYFDISIPVKHVVYYMKLMKIERMVYANLVQFIIINASKAHTKTSLINSAYS